MEFTQGVGSDILSAVVITPKITTMAINESHATYHGHIGEAALRVTLKLLGIKMTGMMYACKGCALAKAKNVPENDY